MKHEPGIAPRTRRDPTATDVAQARADYAAEVGVDHIVLGQWLLTWGTPEFRDFPEWLSALDG